MHKYKQKEQTARVTLEEVKRVFVKIKNQGLSAEDELYADVHTVFENTKNQALGKLKNALRAYKNKEISAEQLQQTFHNARMVGVSVDNQDYKDALRMLAKLRLTNALRNYNQKQCSLEQLQDAFNTAKEEGLQKDDYVFKTAQSLLDSTHEMIERGFVLDGEDSITFKILDCGGQEVFCTNIEFSVDLWIP